MSEVWELRLRIFVREATEDTVTGANLGKKLKLGTATLVGRKSVWQ